MRGLNCADPPHGMGPRNISKQGRKAGNSEIAGQKRGGGMRIPTTDSSYGGGGI